MKAVSITEANTDLHRLTIRGGRCVIAEAIGGLPANPALLQHARERRQSWENRVTDQITRFAGSMKFVYLHVIWFGSWIIFRVEPTLSARCR